MIVDAYFFRDMNKTMCWIGHIMSSKTGSDTASDGTEAHYGENAVSLSGVEQNMCYQKSQEPNASVELMSAVSASCDWLECCGDKSKTWYSFMHCKISVDNMKSLSECLKYCYIFEGSSCRNITVIPDKTLTTFIQL